MKTHPIEILLRKEKKKKVKIRKREVISFKEAKNKEENCKTLRKINWNKFAEYKTCRGFRNTYKSWSEGEGMTNNIGKE